MNAALRKHKEIMKTFPRNGEGLDAFVDSSDTGYTLNQTPVETKGVSNGLKKINVLNDDVKTNGHATNGHSAGANGVDVSTKHASGPEGVDGLQGNPNGHLVK